MIVIRVLGTLSDDGQTRPFTPERLDQLREQWWREHPKPVPAVRSKRSKGLGGD